MADNVCKKTYLAPPSKLFKHIKVIMNMLHYQRVSKLNRSLKFSSGG